MSRGAIGYSHTLGVYLSFERCYLHLPFYIFPHRLFTMHLLALFGGTKNGLVVVLHIDSVVSSFEMAGLSPTTKSGAEILAILHIMSRIEPKGLPWRRPSGSRARDVGTDAPRADIGSLLDGTFPLFLHSHAVRPGHLRAPVLWRIGGMRHVLHPWH